MRLLRIILGLISSALILSSAICCAQVSAQSPVPGPERPWEDEIIYVLPIDRFSNSDTANDIMLKRFGKEAVYKGGGYRGGDLNGVLQKMDYLSDLGVTTIFLSPVMQNDRIDFFGWLAGGYRPIDYFNVDENLGTTEVLCTLVNNAHSRGMRIMLDVPIVYPGVQHPLYTQENREKGYFQLDNPGYGVFPWNADNEFIANYLIEVSNYWKNLTGCQAFRLDSAMQLSDAFWRRYVAEVDAGTTPDDFFLMAENAWAPWTVGDFLKNTGIDSAYDFPFYGGVQRSLAKQHKMSVLVDAMKQGEKYYPNPGRTTSELNNYDLDVYTSNSLEPKIDRMKLGIGFQMTTNRIPMMYAGDEKAIWITDPDQLFNPVNDKPEFQGYVKRMIALRKSQPALRRGASEMVNVSTHTLSFVHSYEQDRILVMLNNTSKTLSVKFDMLGQKWANFEFYDLLNNRMAKSKGKDIALNVNGFEVRVFKVLPNNTSAKRWNLFADSKPLIPSNSPTTQSRSYERVFPAKTERRVTAKTISRKNISLML